MIIKELKVLIDIGLWCIIKLKADNVTQYFMDIIW